MAAPAITYSFLDVSAAISGPGGSFPFDGEADEGITVDMEGDKVTTVIGAGGFGMHSLHAAQNGTITVRLLKTSPVNRQLQDLYNYQTQSSAYSGQNTISVRDPVRGDDVLATQCAFRKQPNNTYGREGGVQEWAFNAVVIHQRLGDGTQRQL